METHPTITQLPLPGESRVLYAGEYLTFKLILSFKVHGRAFIRTNLGAAILARNEIVRRVENNEIKLDEAWYDLEMVQIDALTYTIILPLNQTGYFQAKCLFIPDQSSSPLWPAGENTIINVEPAGTCCANIIYNAFVRQFGKTKTGLDQDIETRSSIKQLDSKGYTVIPESGKFRDLIQHVEFVFSTLGCRVLHLLPIHPTPTTYAKMGRFGSPYAALNFTEVDPALAEFDPSATPLEQFLELSDRVHFHNGYLFLDIAINHTGWAASIHESHPEWLVRGDDGQIEAPSAWGVVWADLTKLDYTKTDIWEYMANVFLLWCHRGVDGFRCDAGYMIPVDAWEYIVAKVRLEYPETLFFLEGLGGLIKITKKILSNANFNWAYSELFQNYSRDDINSYLPIAYDISNTCGHMIHFAETHDNNRLASVSVEYAKMRTSLCALFSVCGGFGFANGVEWFAKEKIDVHESTSLNWGNKRNQVDHISKLNLILKNHPTFFSKTSLSFIQDEASNCLVLMRDNTEYNKTLLVLVNPDIEHSQNAVWGGDEIDIENNVFYDLIENSIIEGSSIETKKEIKKVVIKMSPGEVLALTTDPEDVKQLKHVDRNQSILPAKVYTQKLLAKILDVQVSIFGYGHVDKQYSEKEAIVFARDPVTFLRNLNPESNESRVVVFDADRDIKRQLMVPPGWFVLVRSRYGFRAEILDEKKSGKVTLGYEEGMPDPDGNRFFALFAPQKIKNQHLTYSFYLRVFDPEKVRIEKTTLLYLAPMDQLYMWSSFNRKEIVSSPFLKLLGTTNKGGMMRAAAWWGRLDSKYDAFLGANIDKTTPENRWMVLSRCRIWAIYQGYSRELRPDCLEKFIFSYDHGGKWLFHVPTSEGKYYALELFLSIDEKENHVNLTLHRKPSLKEDYKFLSQNKKITLIVRPDIEDRSFHDTIKAFTGPENNWPRAISPHANGFDFLLSNNHVLNLRISKGHFIHEPEWNYMVHRPLEEQRGLDAASDLFSPGYFKVHCLGGDSVHLDAKIVDTLASISGGPVKKNQPESILFEKGMPLSEAMYKSLDAFIVDREGDKSVIAGYPWFLDWGRDSLIFCRGLIELKRFDEARAILRLFGRFENKGTLPNMITGKDAANIETSDAPLWFFTCCKDLIKKENSNEFLSENLGIRTVKEVLLSIGNSLIAGTKTGVMADPDTFLLYSPSHFTWMDTNFPAGSPRQGYPVEIQALWYNALEMLADIDPKSTISWKTYAARVKTYIHTLFYKEKSGFFSDCLHSAQFCSAKDATPDDALRPNQLFLITLGVVSDLKIKESCVESCQELLVPGAIRSLADRKVEYPINILYNHLLLNNPYLPYSGKYEGDEDTQRKPAYHNGTAWTWPFPSFCEAWAQTFGPESVPTCLAWLGSAIDLMRKGAAGYLPEILDGDFPHTPRGCDAQAWGSSEFARVMHKLQSNIKERF